MKMSKKELDKEIDYFYEICAFIIRDERVVHVSEQTNLSVSTVYRIKKGQMTGKSRIETLQKLERAFGIRLNQTKNSSKIELI